MVLSLFPILFPLLISAQCILIMLFRVSNLPQIPCNFIFISEAALSFLLILLSSVSSCHIFCYLSLLIWPTLLCLVFLFYSFDCCIKFKIPSWNVTLHMLSALCQYFAGVFIVCKKALLLLFIFFIFLVVSLCEHRTHFFLVTHILMRWFLSCFSGQFLWRQEARVGF